MKTALTLCCVVLLAGCDPADKGNPAGGSGGAGGGSIDPGSPDGSVAPVDAPIETDDGSANANCTIGSSGALGLIPGGSMAPGTACATCHLVSRAKLLVIAGTVYTDPHEGDLCLGVGGSDLTVLVTDKNGGQHSIPVNSVGNFYDDNPLDLLMPQPWQVAVVRGSQMRPMVGAVTNGDCNTCHTAAGAQNAPGRILAP